MTELRFLKELMLIKQVHQKTVINFSFKFQPNVCSRCHDLTEKTRTL